MTQLKNNLSRSDVADFYKMQCACLKALDILSASVSEHLGNDKEFNKWFLSMHDMFVSQFVTFVFSKTRFQTEKREVVSRRFKEFVQKKKKDKEKEEEYRESRPDLYD